MAVYMHVFPICVTKITRKMTYVRDTSKLYMYIIFVHLASFAGNGLIKTAGDNHLLRTFGFWVRDFA